MFDILKKIQEEDINIAKLARETGINASRIYKWKDRTSKITLEDAIELEKWGLKNLDNSKESNSGKPDRQPGLLPLLPDAAIQELYLTVKRIEQRINQVFPEGTGNLFDVVQKAVADMDTLSKKGKSDRQK